MGKRSYHVYVMTNKKNGTLYIGVTNNLHRRVFEHRQVDPSTFAGKYGLTKLIYAVEFSEVTEAISWEKIIKRWTRARKLELIEASNPDWSEVLILDSSLRSE
jgi:putative endonuclease